MAGEIVSRRSGLIRMRNSIERRQFLATLAALPAANSLLAQEVRDGMIYRNLGATGQRVSAIGLGGYHIGVPEETAGIRLIRSAIDRGITFLDNSCDYHEGGSEMTMGKALRDGYREKVFLMTKFNGRTRAKTAEQIDTSLKRLQTDHIDLIQFHENIRTTDPERFFAPGGAHEAVTAAKKAGKVRFIGFTGHKDPSIHLLMLAKAQQNGFHFDTCQMPLNVLDYHFRSFAHEVVPKLIEQRIGVLGMKPMASGIVFQSGAPVTGIECLHYALNLPTSVVITGCENEDRLNQAMEAAHTFKPMTQSQLATLVAKTRQYAVSGKYEPFKTTENFDGTTHDPASMG